jgi:hypothetical protein
MMTPEHQVLEAYVKLRKAAEEFTEARRGMPPLTRRMFSRFAALCAAVEFEGPSVRLFERSLGLRAPEGEEDKYQERRT